MEREDHPKTESTSTGLAELSPPSPPGQWGNSRKQISPVSQAPSDLIEANGSTPMELEDYTGIKELFAEPDEGLSKFQCSKFQLGPKVVYGGTVLEATKVVGDSKRTVFMNLTNEKLEAFINFPIPSCKKDIQSICGPAVQLKRWTPGLIIESAGL